MSIIFPYTLTSSLGALQWPKVDGQPVPPGADPTTIMSSSDWNVAMQSITELGLGITSGSLFGYQRFAVAPTASAGPNQNSSDFDWLDSAGQRWQHTRDGVDKKFIVSSFVVTAGQGLQGTGPLTGSSYVVSLAPTGSGASTYNSSIQVNQYGQVTSGSVTGVISSLSASYGNTTNVSGNILVINTSPGPLTVRSTNNAQGLIFSVQEAGGVSLISIQDNTTCTYRSRAGNTSQSTAFQYDTINAMTSNNKVFRYLGGGVELAYLRSDGTLMFSNPNTGVDVTGSNMTLNVGALSASIVNVGRAGASIFLSGTTNVSKIVGAGASPTFTTNWGAGANGGVGATVTVSGTDTAHLLSITTGTGTVPNAAIVTGTFVTAFNGSPRGWSLTAGNAAAAAALSAAFISADDTFNAAGVRYVLRVGALALTPSTSFKFSLTFIG